MTIFKMNHCHNIVFGTQEHSLVMSLVFRKLDGRVFTNYGIRFYGILKPKNTLSSKSSSTPNAMDDSVLLLTLAADFSLAFSSLHCFRRNSFCCCCSCKSRNCCFSVSLAASVAIPQNSNPTCDNYMRKFELMVYKMSFAKQMCKLLLHMVIFIHTTIV